MFKILCEMPFRNSVWCNEILSGLINALKKRRYTYKEIYNSNTLNTEDWVFVLGTNPVWLSNAVTLSNKKGITPIVFAPRSDDIVGQFHSVYTDLNKLISTLVQSLHGNEKKRIALYGINPASVSDMFRMKSFKNATANSAPVFFNNGSLDTCFTSFLPYIENFDAVICPNSPVAASLVQKLYESNTSVNEECTIISCTKNFLPAEFSKKILYTDTMYHTLGELALVIYDCAKRKENIACMTVYADYKTDATLHTAPQEPNEQLVSADTGAFYQDITANNYLNIDKLFQQSDKTDRQILIMLTEGHGYSVIAEKCFISESSVKYRMKKLMKLAHVTSKQNLIEILKKIM